jgi:hypothetical protein
MRLPTDFGGNGTEAYYLFSLLRTASVNRKEVTVDNGSDPSAC